MFGKKNKIAIVLTWIGIASIVAGFFSGIGLGETNVGMYSDIYERSWSITFIYWVSGFISGMFFIAIAEIIEQLHKLNLKLNKEPEEDEFELLD